MPEPLYKKNMLEWYDKLYCKSEKTKEQIKFLSKIFKKNRCGKILDVPCGTGRHSIELAKKGFSVTGLDIEKSMIKYAKEKSKNISNIKFALGDMRNFKLKETFDAAIVMYGSFAYMTTNKDALACLQSIKKHLKKNGLIIIEDDNPWQDIVSGKKKLVCTAQNKKLKLITEFGIKTMHDNNIIHVSSIYRRFSGKKKLPVIKDTKPVTLRVFSRNEMELLLLHAGFNDIKFFSNFKGEKLSKRNYRKLITVARKS